MGAVYPAICGRVLCGQTLCGTTRATWEKPQLVLKPRTFSITITEGPLVQLSVNRPVLYLIARSFEKQSSSSPAFGRAVLQLRGKPFSLPLAVVLPLNRPRLVLLARAFTIGLSSTLAFGRPVLYLRGGVITRVGRPGLVPTVPESETLAPSPVETGLLVPTVAEAELLVPTSTAVR